MLNIINKFNNNEIGVEEIFISNLVDEFTILYNENKLSSTDQLDCLEFINTLFKIKHKLILNFNKEKRGFKRDTQLFHLKKIQRMAKERIVKPKYIPKKVEITSEVSTFKELIKALNKKIKQEISYKTKLLLDELMRERWTVQDKISLLKSVLESKSVKFDEILESEDSEEIITSFLALLDLKRKEEVEVIQRRNFGEILIKKLPK